MCVSYYQVIDMIGDCFGTRLDELVIIFPFHIWSQMDMYEAINHMHIVL